MIARTMVLASTVAAITAVIAADTVIDHGSGTYFALIIFTPFLLLPGLLVWLKPEARSLVLWAVWSGIGGIVYGIGGSPYRYERERVYWPWVSWSIGTAIAIAVFGSVVLAFVMAARSRDRLPPSRRAIRVQRTTTLAVAAAAMSIVLGFYALGDATIAAPVWLGLLIVLVVAPAPLIYRRPHRRAAIMWALWSSPFGGIIALIFSTEDLQFDPHEHLLFAAYGTLALLTVLVLPIVAFMSSDDQELPEARMRG
ncbi:MAG TPA: hypothetical protein VLB44_26555 [Kofleriaceae bacterium]|nr:hypothetical protein [Kofleriaceae bacterium]